jgi:hypothetical protein
MNTEDTYIYIQHTNTHNTDHQVHKQTIHTIPSQGNKPLNKLYVSVSPCHRVNSFVD